MAAMDCLMSAREVVRVIRDRVIANNSQQSAIWGGVGIGCNRRETAWRQLCKDMHSRFVSDSRGQLCYAGQ
jgi:hypothetical protein